MESRTSALRNMFPSRVRSNNGCWTCRLRRKKCDEKRPVCDGCSSLEITCYFEDEKPAWMDGGAKQRDMADKVKQQVKKQASQRRDRRYLEILEAGTRMVSISDKEKDKDGDEARMAVDHDGVGSNDGEPRHAQSMKPSAFTFSSGPASGASDTDAATATTGAHSHSTPESSNGSSAQSEAPWQSQPFTRSNENDADAEADYTFIMIYLDYVFPYMFPHYRPPLSAGGRGWILNLLHSSASVHNTVVSIASYFFGVVMAGDTVEHEGCMAEMERKLQVKIELGLKGLQNEMCQINARKSHVDMQRGLITLHSILMMLIFEVATSNKENWKLHLDAALALFRQIIPTPELWGQTLHGLDQVLWPPSSTGLKRPWSTNQASLRFFTANLLHIDVISSVTLESAPRLQNYQSTLAPSSMNMEPPSLQVIIAREEPMELERFTGLFNWINEVLGKVSALAAWKTERRNAGEDYAEQLVCRSSTLLETINCGLRRLEHALEKPDPEWQGTFALTREGSFPAQILEDLEQVGDHQVVLHHNYIWLQAILTYLYIVISGWQPSNPEIRRSADKTRDRLATVPRSTCLRAHVWPLCVTACLAPKEDEETFRRIAQRLGSLRSFGTMKEATEVMEAVWAKRDELDEDWNIAKCMNVLGHGVLLL